MKLRINNDKLQVITVVLEPWANEFQLNPGDYLDFISDKKVPENAYFQVEYSEYGVIVFPEWEGALVFTYNSKGEVID